MPQTFLRHKPRRLALMLNLQWPFMRHAEIFSGNQRYAEEWGWTSILDESARDTPPQAECSELLGGSSRGRINCSPGSRPRPSSPAQHLLPGVYPDSTEAGRLVAKHLLTRGFRTVATLTSPKNIDNVLEVKEFARLVREGRTRTRTLLLFATLSPIPQGWGSVGGSIPASLRSRFDAMPP